MVKRIRLITALLKEGVKFVFIPAMETIVPELLAELSTPQVLVYTSLNVVTDTSRPFLLRCQCGRVRRHPRTKARYHTIRPIVFISHASIEFNVTGIRSIWKRATWSGASSTFEVT